MAAWNSSSLAFSDHNNSRQSGSGLLKNTSTRISKQHLTEQKMFGSRRGKTGKDFKLGKKFHAGMSQKLSKDPKSTGISPSIAEFDKMMKNVVGKNSSKKSKGFLSRKQFG